MSSQEQYKCFYEDIVRFYEEDFLDIYTIANKLNIGSSTVMRILHRNNVEIRGRIDYKNKYYHNDNIFSSNNIEVPYWVGFLLTDGCIHKYKDKIRAPRITLQLKESDKEILEKYVNFLQFDGNITQDKIKRWTVTIHSYKIAQDLEKFNVKPQKTFIAEAPSVFENNSLFWRGVLDGDGSIYLQDNILRINLLSASLKFIQQFQNYCNKIINNESRASISTMFTKQGNEMFRITYCGRFAILILKEIYSTNGPRLKRKYDLYLNSKDNKYALE
jgi:hypothetical protein